MLSIGLTVRGLEGARPGRPVATKLFVAYPSKIARHDPL
jgi:hypothetical protein